LDVYHVNNYLLVIKWNNEESDQSAIDEMVFGHVKKAKVRMTNAAGMFAEVTYEIAAEDKKIAVLAEALQKNKQIESYNLVAYSGEMVG